MIAGVFAPFESLFQLAQAHPLDAINTTFLIGVAFAAGKVWQKVSHLEKKVDRLFRVVQGPTARTRGSDHA